MSDEFDVDPLELTLNDLVSNNPKCTSYAAGHVVHWIQARKAAEDSTEFPVQVTVDDNDLIRFTFNGEEVVRRSHDTDRLAAALFYADGHAFWKPRWRILSVEAVLGRYFFNVATVDEWKPCHG